MSSLGKPHQKWNKELDDKLLSEVSSGKNLKEIEVDMRMSNYTINKRLKEMGFESFNDARKVMTD